MGTVRPSLKPEIMKELDNSSFGMDLFEVNVQRDDFLLQITFIPKPEFKFFLKEYKEVKNARYRYVTSEAPGQWMLEFEEFQHESFQNARQRISNWNKRIEDDYLASKDQFEGLEKLRQTIINGFDTLNIPEGEQFSSEEKHDRDSRLDDLEERIESIYKERNADRQQIILMKAQIRKLKNAMDVLDKRTWMLAAANRILNIFKEVRMAVGDVQAITKDFDNLLPNLSDDSEA